MRVIRKRYRVLLFAALVAALVVPVGFALSLESPAAPQTTRSTIVMKPTIPAAAVVAAPVLIHSSQAPATVPVVRTMSDSFRLLLVGTVLFGLAAFVRRAV